MSKVKELGIGKPNGKMSVNLDMNLINDYFVNLPIDLSSAQERVWELSAAPMCVLIVGSLSCQ